MGSFRGILRARRAATLTLLWAIGTATAFAADYEAEFADLPRIYPDDTAFQVTLRALVAPSGQQWPVVDNLGRQVDTLNGPIGPGAVQRSVSGLPPGYYTLRAPSGAAVADFIITIPTDQYPNDAASRFGVDYALSARTGLVEWQDIDADYIQRNLDMARRAGVRHVRERFSPKQIYREGQPLDIDQLSGIELDVADAVLSAEEAAGLIATALCHPMPPFLGTDSGELGVPRDLRDAYAIFRDAEEHFGDRIDVWEVWNEVDLLGFYLDSAAEYASFLKVAALALRDADPTVRITASSMAEAPADFHDAIMENGVAPYFDIFNYHTYNDPASQLPEARDRVEYMNRWGIGGYPLYLTETGLLINADEDVDFSPADSRLASRHIAQTFAEAASAGVDRVFYFLWKFFKRGKYGAIVDANFEVTERLAALATVNRMLGNGEHRGRLLTTPPTLAHLFTTSAGQCLVAWTTGGTRDLSVGVGGIPEAVFLTGEDYAFSQTGTTVTLSVGVDPVYLRAETITAPLTTTTVARAPTTATAPITRTVFDLRFTSEPLYERGLGAHIVDPGTTVPAELWVYNFDPAEAWSGTLDLATSGDWRATPDAVEVSVAPMSRALVPVAISATTDTTVRRWDRLAVRTLDSAAELFVRFTLPIELIEPTHVTKLIDPFASGVYAPFYPAARVDAVTTDTAEGIAVAYTNTREGEVWWGAVTANAAANGLGAFDLTGYDAIRVSVDVMQVQPGSLWFIWLDEPDGASYGSKLLDRFTTPGSYQMIFPLAQFTWLDGSTVDDPDFALDRNAVVDLHFGVHHLGADRRGFPEVLEAGYTVAFEVTDIELLAHDVVQPEAIPPLEPPDPVQPTAADPELWWWLDRHTGRPESRSTIGIIE